MKLKLTQDLTDPNAKDPKYYGHNIGRVVKQGENWFQVTKADRAYVAPAQYMVIASGKRISADKAAVLSAQWEAQQQARWDALSARVARLQRQG